MAERKKKTEAEGPEAPAAESEPGEEPGVDEGPAEEPAAEALSKEVIEEAPAEEIADEASAEAAGDEPPAEEPPAEAAAARSAPAVPRRTRAERKARAEKRAAAKERVRSAAKKSGGRKPIVRLPKHERTRGKRRERRGVVVSSAMDKTIVVRVDTSRAHPVYKKVVRRSTKFHAHDEKNEANVGDVVRIVESRPISKTKHWRLAEIVEVAK
jgi:small subunit ribosomal protein S17